MMSLMNEARHCRRVFGSWRPSLNQVQGDRVAANCMQPNAGGVGKGVSRHNASCRVQAGSCALGPDAPSRSWCRSTKLVTCLPLCKRSSLSRLALGDLCRFLAQPPWRFLTFVRNDIQFVILASTILGSFFASPTSAYPQWASSHAHAKRARAGGAFSSVTPQ